MLEKGLNTLKSQDLKRITGYTIQEQDTGTGTGYRIHVQVLVHDTWLGTDLGYRIHIFIKQKNLIPSL